MSMIFKIRTFYGLPGILFQKKSYSEVIWNVKLERTKLETNKQKTNKNIPQKYQACKHNSQNKVSPFNWNIHKMLSKAWDRRQSYCSHRTLAACQTWNFLLQWWFKRLKGIMWFVVQPLSLYFFRTLKREVFSFHFALELNKILKFWRSYISFF